MKKLVTGGTGLVGSKFENAIKVNSSIDLRVKENAFSIIQKHQPDVVIHTAAKVGGILANIKYPVNFFNDNFLINTNVIDACYQNNVKKMVCFLSTCIFPNEIEYPIDETKIHLGPPHTSNFGYSYAKRMADVQIQAYNQQYGTKYFSVIPCNLYGENDNFHLENGHVIPMLIHKCYLSKINETPLEIWGTGTPMREFVYSKDVAEITNLLIDNYTDTTPVVISNSVEYPISYIVNIITECMNYKGEIIYRTDKPDGQLRKPSDNKKLLSIIGDYKFTRIEDGLEKTIKWFNENYNTLRK